MISKITLGLSVKKLILGDYYKRVFVFQKMNKILDYNDFNPVNKSDWENRVKLDLKLENIQNIQEYLSEKGGQGIQPYYDESDLTGLEYLEGLHNFLVANFQDWKNYSKLKVADNKQLQEDIKTINNNDTEGTIIEVGDGFDRSYLDLKSLDPRIEVSLELQNSSFTPDSLFRDSIPDNCGFISGVDSSNLLSYNGFRTLELIELNTLSPSDELGSLLYQAKKYIDKYEAALNHTEVLNRMFIKINIGQNFFEEIAKLRALRTVFFAFAYSYGISFDKIEPVYIFSTSALFKNDDFKPHENMLKSTSGAMSAIIGGSNSLWVEPEDNSSLSRRIALNVSSILKEESYLGKVADPAFGAYFVEQYTHKIAMEGWNVFLNKITGA